MNFTTAIRRSFGLATVAAALGLATAGTSTHAAGSVGPHSPAISICGSIEVRSPAPAVKAVNRTTAVDSQWVVVQPVLFKWNGSVWARYSTMTAITGLATDTQSPTVWYDFATGARTTSSATAMMTQSGYYALGYDYFWYTGNTVTGSASLYTTHTSPIGAVMPYCTR